MNIIIPANASALAIKIVRRAQLDIPIEENPIGSNRSPEIDLMCDVFGVPRGSYWCALWAAQVWNDAGAEIPPTNDTSHPARAQSWYEWAKATGRFSSKPGFGFASLYGKLGELPADHMGACVVALAPIVMDLEGNTSASSYSREGELTGLKVVEPSRVLGYVSPEPLEVLT